MSRGAAWDGMIVVCAAVRWDGVKMQDRQMAEHLQAHAPVLYVDPPVSHLSWLKNPAVAASMKRPRVRVLGPGLAHFTPIVPPKPMHPAVIPIATWAAKRQLGGAVRALGGQVQAVITTWLFLDVYGVCGEQWRVYSWSDDPVGAARLWGQSADRLAAADERLARASDLVVAVNEGATQRLPGARTSRDVPTKRLRPSPIRRHRRRRRRARRAPRESDRRLRRPPQQPHQDLALLEAVADSGVGLLMIGPKDSTFEPERFARLIAQPNVAYLGPRPYKALPSYLKLADVGLVPYAATEFNRWSFPMKTLEYLAAGRPVVATSLPAIRSLDTDLVTLADTPSEFAASVRQQAELARQPQLVARRRELASMHSWADRADRLVRLLAHPQPTAHCDRSRELATLPWSTKEFGNSTRTRQ